MNYFSWSISRKFYVFIRRNQRFTWRKTLFQIKCTGIISWKKKTFPLCNNRKYLKLGILNDAWRYAFHIATIMPFYILFIGNEIPVSHSTIDCVWCSNEWKGESRRMRSRTQTDAHEVKWANPFDRLPIKTVSKWHMDENALVLLYKVSYWVKVCLFGAVKPRTRKRVKMYHMW